MGHPETNDLGDTDATKTVTLTERDVRDAARLFRLLADPTLAGGMPALFPVPIQTGLGTGQEALISKARIVLNSRRLRERYFASELFGEPAWDILLSLYIAEQSSGRMTTSRLAEQIQTPMTTVVRWLNHLEADQLIERQAHPTDRRTAFIKLLKKGRAALDSYLGSIPG
jgi:DNA-binding MarR family transcriptional regulator